MTRFVARLVVVLVAMGIVLSPLRAVAAPFPMLFAYDVAVRPTTTTVLGAYEAVPSEAERPRFNDYECTHVGYDAPSNAPAMAGAGGVHAYDDALELLERREPAKAATYGFVEPTAAAEGETASSYVYGLVDGLGDTVYYGISNNPARRLAEHAGEGAGAATTEAENIANQIANGHAFEKHVIQQGEFPMVSTADQFAQGAKNVLLSPETQVRALSGGRTAYWNEASQTVLIHNPAASDLGTFFRPVKGIEYFLGLK